MARSCRRSCAKFSIRRQKSFYESEKGTTRYFDLESQALQPVTEPPGIIILKSLKDRSGVVQKNAGASLIDLGDGVLCCEFHSKMNSIGGDLVAMIHAGITRLSTDFDAMVIGNQATNFSVGANLMLVLISAQEGEWDDIHMAVRQFQRVNMAIKYAPRPVVAAPQGMALGGGCEISLHAARIHAAAEAYMGLVETGVGLIPGGGGTKEMLIRANEHAAGRRRSGFVPRAEARLRKYRHGQSFHQRRGSAHARLFAPVGSDRHESRPPDCRRQADGAGHAARRIPSARAGANPRAGRGIPDAARNSRFT